jgi:hypothetical protein
MTKQLREAGHTIQSVAGIGTQLVAEAPGRTSVEGDKSAKTTLQLISEAEKCSTRKSIDSAEDAKTAPVTPPAQAPASPPPEPPADDAPAPGPEIPLGPVPRAGGVVEEDEVSVHMIVVVDRELATLRMCADLLRQMDRPARDRVMAYLASRFMVEW